MPGDLYRHNGALNQPDGAIGSGHANYQRPGHRALVHLSTVRQAGGRALLEACEDCRSQLRVIMNRVAAP